MTNTPDEQNVELREIGLPEEQEVGSDDPEAQARAILEESEERTLHPEETEEESSQSIPSVVEPLDTES